MAANRPPSDTPDLPAGCEALVVDDDATLRRRLAAHLRERGATTTEAGTLAEARRLAHEIRFDFIAMDLHLPDGEGLALLKERIFSENAAVVVMTAFGGVQQAVAAIRLGADDYLAKPFEPDELILAFLRSRRHRTAARREEHAAGPAEGFTLDSVIVDLVAEALRDTNNNVSAAARRLGVTREFLRYRLREDQSSEP